MKNKGKAKAFTLAEVLITLAIIGVVAALTIPAIITNYQKKMYVTQLKKTYTSINNGFRTYMANEGVTKLEYTRLFSMLANNYDTPAPELLTKNPEFKKEFEKIFKVIAVYNNNRPEKYDYKYKLLNNKDDSYSNSNPVVLADGTIIFFDFGSGPQNNTHCGSKNCRTLKEFQLEYQTPTKLWESIGWFNIDVNGPKPPNTWGRDFFLFELGNDGMLYPWGGEDFAIFSGCEYKNLNSCPHIWYCQNPAWDCAAVSSSEGTGCAGRIMAEGWEMKY